MSDRCSSKWSILDEQTAGAEFINLDKSDIYKTEFYLNAANKENDYKR